MTVLRESGIQNYIGSSGDTKPASAPIGSIFFEYDTTAKYKCYDGVNWTLYEVQGLPVIATGTFTTSSATVPADTGKAALATHAYRGCTLIPLSGANAFLPRLVADFTTTTGVYTIDPTNPFPAVTGLVAYAICGTQAHVPKFSTYKIINGFGDVPTTGALAVNKTITATAEASGLGNADKDVVIQPYFAWDSATVFQAIRAAVHHELVVTGLSAGANLRARLYVGAQDAAHLLIDSTITAAVTDVKAAEFTDAVRIAALCTTANAHFYLFLWKTAAGAGDTTVTDYQAWFGCGQIYRVGASYYPSLLLNHSGRSNWMVKTYKKGDGTTPNCSGAVDNGSGGGIVSICFANLTQVTRAMWLSEAYIALSPYVSGGVPVVTDICVIGEMDATLEV